MGDPTTGGPEQPERDPYQLWVNDERTLLVRLWDDGSLEVARRDDPSHSWGPPQVLTQER